MNNGRKSSADEGYRCIDIDNEERLRLEKDIEVLQKRICEFEVYLMQMDATLGGMSFADEFCLSFIRIGSMGNLHYIDYFVIFSKKKKFWEKTF